MFGSTTLEVAICLSFIYLLMSLAASTMVEWVSSLKNQRGTVLLEGIKNLLNDPNFTALTQQFYCHGLIAGISQDAASPDTSNRLPSYIPAPTFALALLDLLAAKNAVAALQEALQLETKKGEVAAADPAAAKIPGSSPLLLKLTAINEVVPADWSERWRNAEGLAKKVLGPQDLANLQKATVELQELLEIGRTIAAELPDPLSNLLQAVQKLPAGHTRESLLVLVTKIRLDCAAGNATPADQMQKLQKCLEEWFDSTMDRVGGWYKRWTQKMLIVFSCIFVLGANVDTLLLAKRFTTDANFRTSIIALAQKETAQTTIPPDLIKDSWKITLPLGWVPQNGDRFAKEQVPDTLVGWSVKLLGLLITMAAVSLGAPFWFDTLSKIVNLRGAGTPPGETKKSAPQPEVLTTGRKI